MRMDNQGTEETFKGDCCARGYLVTEKDWKDIALGESLTVCTMKKTSSTIHMRWHREHGPGNGRMNVPAYTYRAVIDSSLLRQTSTNISAKVRQKNYRASNLEQGGLEVPITVQWASFPQKGQLMKRLKQLIT